MGPYRHKAERSAFAIIAGRQSQIINRQGATLAPLRDERGLQFFAACEAQSAGYGGIAAASWATERPAADAIVRQPQQIMVDVDLPLGEILTSELSVRIGRVFYGEFPWMAASSGTSAGGFCG